MITAKERTALIGSSHAIARVEDAGAEDGEGTARRSIARSQLDGEETTSGVAGPPSYKIGRVAAALAGGPDAFDSLGPDEQRRYEDRAVRALLGRAQWSDSVRRRVALQLAIADGIPSLTLLSPSERQTYEDRAVETLRGRQALRIWRQYVRDRLADQGVRLTPEAVQQFVARHKREEPEEFERSLQSYLMRKRRPQSETAGRGP
jgi:hypothetical protein